MSAEDRKIRQEIDDSLKVSSYLDAVYNQITGQGEVNPDIVPNYSTAGNAGLSRRGATANESSMLPGMPLATEALFQAAANAMDIHQPTASQPVTKVSNVNMSAPPAPQQPENTISKKQWIAIQKYPALIEAIGGSMGDKIVAEILTKVNAMMVEKLEKNAKQLSKYAQRCVANKHNIKQYYVNPEKKWACQVIASGPFRGDEVLFFDPEKDKSMILRLNGKKYENVSKEFNVVHELIKLAEEDLQQIAQDSCESNSDSHIQEQDKHEDEVDDNIPEIVE